MSLVVLFGLPGPRNNGRVYARYENLDQDGYPVGEAVSVQGLKIPVDVIIFANKTPFGLVLLKHLGVLYDGDTTTIAEMRRRDLFKDLVRGSYKNHNIRSLIK